MFNTIVNDTEALDSTKTDLGTSHWLYRQEIARGV